MSTSLSPARLNAGTPVGVNGVSKQYGSRTILNPMMKPGAPPIV